MCRPWFSIVMVRLSSCFGDIYLRVRYGRRMPRQDVLVRMSMTVEAPFHMQGRSPPSQRHIIDAPVARLTVDAFRGVYAMMEIDEVRQVVYSDPVQRLLCLPALMNRRQHFTIHPELRVAAEAQLCSWHPG